MNDFGRVWKIPCVALFSALLLGLMTAAAPAGPALAAGPAYGAWQDFNLAAAPAQSYYADLSADEAAGVLYMVQEEKLARDVYLTLAGTWEAAVFSNIAASEQQHMEAVSWLADKYGLEDPIADDGVGAFRDQAFSDLFGLLTTQGAASLEAAYRVGATIEDLDIFDLGQRLAGTDNQDLEYVYTNLTAGSENHLRAFATNLEALGASYQAQYISDDYLALILAGQSGAAAGNGPGAGAGNGYRGGGVCRN